MKIIINRGFDKIFSRIVISSSAGETIVRSARQDCCVFEAKEGEAIAVKLRFAGGFTLPIASMDSCGDDDTFYISPSPLFKRWVVINYMLFPAFFLSFFVMQYAVKSDLLNWIIAGWLVLWALSMIIMAFSPCVSFFGNRMFMTKQL